VSIWVSAQGAPPSIGSVTPRVANAGATVTISGAGFGTTAGTVTFAQGSTSMNAAASNWGDGQIAATVPALAAGNAQVTVVQGTDTSNAAPFVVSSGTLLPVNFSVNGVPALAGTDVVMLTGNVAELGNWATTWNGATGPVTIPASGSALLTVALPAGAAVQFKFLVLHGDGSVTWEGGGNHSFVVPASGVGAVAVSWQS